MSIVPEIETRRARRAISSEPIDETLVEEVVRASTLAPSCFNNQPWRIIAVKNEQEKPIPEAFRAALTLGNAWALRAPWYFVICTATHLDCRMDEGRDYAYFDAGQAAFALQLQAQHTGLIAHPIAGFSPSKIRAALSIPKEYVPLVVIVLGKPGTSDALSEKQKADEQAPRVRKPLGEIVYAQSFGIPFSSLP